MGDNHLPMFPLRLDEEDRSLVEGLSQKEKLTRTEVIRRAIRHYAAHLGVKQPKPKKGERR